MKDEKFRELENDEDFEIEEVELRPEVINPFEQDVIDLVNYSGDNNYVVTFKTITNALYDLWEKHTKYNDCLEFSIDNLLLPGIYRDDWRTDSYEPSDGCYTIVVKEPFLAEKLVRDKLEE